MKKLALTMIVRDEAERLPAFLSHHRGLYDQLVVVDTGSEDETVALLDETGATVLSATWGDDFAAARNIGLDQVTADWVLFLDADERVAQADFAALRATMDCAPDKVFLQETWNYCPGTSHLEWQPLPGRYPQEESNQTGMFVARRVGLFPRRADLRFSGLVHESVLPAATAAGLKVVPLDIPVHHYGYSGDQAHNAARQARYRHLVELKHAANPDDPSAQLELATVYLEDGDSAGALTLLHAVAGGPAGLRPVVRGLVLCGRLHREMGQPNEAEKLLAEAVRQDPDFVFAWLEQIRLAAEARDWPGAERLLHEAEGRFGPGHPQFLREALRVQIYRQRLPEALATAERLISFCPQWQEIRDLSHRLRRMLQ